MEAETLKEKTAGIGTASRLLCHGAASFGAGGESFPAQHRSLFIGHAQFVSSSYSARTSILRLSKGDQYGKSGAKEELVTAVEAYIRMYRAHIAREDTVVYPMLSKVSDTTELKNFIEQIKAKELKLFGDERFLQIVEEVAAIEQQLKIDDLDSFTARDAK